MKVDHKDVIAGNRRALSKAITLVESTNPEDFKEAEKLLEKCLETKKESIRIGITGIPGVGKSTFIDSLALLIAETGTKVAVLAVDPSSPVSGGSILGDKTRMSKISNHENVYIRPTPSSGSLGGVANKTKEVLHLCESAGHEVILVETVGVGQSEYEVSDIVDLFLLLLLPSTGDELQGIKKGIVEIADAIIINKADGELKRTADITVNEYNNALSILGTENKKQIFACSALENKNIKEVWTWVQQAIEETKKDGSFREKRAGQNIAWSKRLLMELIKNRIQENKNIAKKYDSLTNKVADGKITPMKAAKEILDLTLEK